MGADGFIEAIRSLGPIGALLATLATILASVVRAIISGALIPRKSHDEIVNAYRERAAEALEREHWARERLYREERISERAIDITADLATRRSIIDSARRPNRGTGDA